MALTKDIKRRIARIAFDRMKRECETDFAVLSGFQTELVGTFLEWIKGVTKLQRLEAALSVTRRHLKLGHIDCENVPNFETWANSFVEFPIWLNRTWHPQHHSKRIISLVNAKLGPLCSLGDRSISLADDNQLSITQIRTGLELNTRVADIVLLQFFNGDDSLFDLSYIALLGLGPTGWRANDEADCTKAIAQLPSVIAMAKELV